MSRRKAAPKRVILPDPKFHSQLVAKFVNCLMESGKKSVAEKIVYDALKSAASGLNIRVSTKKEDGETDAGVGGVSKNSALVQLFEKVLENIRPSVEVRSRRVGGATYQIPMEIRAERSTALAMRWLINCARSRGEKGMALRLAGEMAAAYEGKGSAVKKRDDTHRMAEANRAFAHFRW